MSERPAIEDLLRELAPQVLGVVMRRYGGLDAAEDAVQEALIAAAEHWPGDGVPDNPRGWLLQVASRRLTDQIRSEQARRRRELNAAASQPPPVQVPAEDDTLTLLFLCCHPVLTPASAIALTLRAVGGLTTAEIAGAFLVPESTMAQRISRAKQRIKASGVPFRLPTPGRAGRPAAVGAARPVPHLQRGLCEHRRDRPAPRDLASEAIRLTRAVHRLLPDDGQVTGLLALMLLTEARRLARTGPGGELVPLAEQDRSRWDHQLIARRRRARGQGHDAGPSR